MEAIRTPDRHQMRPIRLLLVDDSAQFLESAARSLAQEPEMNVVGQAGSGRQALIQSEHLHPDLVVMDVVMAAMNGLEATRRIKAQAQAPAVIILSLYDSPQLRSAAEAAGADGFVSKQNFQQLPPLIRRLCPAGKRHLPPAQSQEERQPV